MAFGCFASLLLWLAIVSILAGSMIPIALAVILIAAVATFRGIQSEWPLY